MRAIVYVHPKLPKAAEVMSRNPVITCQWWRDFSYSVSVVSTEILLHPLFG
jgi:hypothetical protein